MGLILNLETATTNCSVCLAKDGNLIAIRENNTPNYSHAEQLHVFIQECLHEAKCSPNDLDAIAVSKGPGSYTGLRIGVSAAKGLCFALDVPLISIATLESMASQLNLKERGYIIPVLDARRMEVYSAVFDSHLNEIRETQAEIIEEYSFHEYLKNNKVHFLGSGADKIRSTLGHVNADFDIQCVPSSREMARLSHGKFKSRDFEDVAYFEPYYLKDFMVTKKK
ncbi:tRNA (adenosine(37)-N6)-threonylcarbamoyltransferase complex dimerization subunit type 1 TsaB [Maribacter cobaltidurans]|uniref:tRNA (Adenosine(37)-N6)-threonylcarbamoyltransferase complex dimerization subunit type 1 TsaB n=1 Tax=Maribacter cobaltidurans TaxID=1178778 RepID=A0A223V3S3_9FLAO|nr:tRNA (adenosine(37)-N6)-threonylcarbamoyltransferase complex dimerization subunit type 1 TsaB [Maribacter cobaltidurans]ASV29469.1 tRNA (adenosine(37)-N6)-threonylcarbamoyltransferase complex dimerization subunit type 1 TsaB [Maribacter cobaltidurans]GGD68764.1 tRNA (adenosine(37)-N6)-threonylcarbamoyltransferase complex dimerization subunit type 1 TsaB [Maribacter cobaltidurans]